MIEKSKENRSKVSMSYVGGGSGANIPKLVTDEGRKNWVMWGQNDNMASSLFDLYNRSGFHRAIIDSRVDMMVGDGITQASDEPSSERTEQFIKNPNNYEDLTETYKKLSYDYELYGIAYIELIYSRSRKTISEIHHIDASKIRWGKKPSNRLSHVFYSKDWKKLTKYPPEPIMVFNPLVKEDTPRQILPIVRYTPSVDYYTLPSYYSVLKWINIDYEISNFHEHNIMNGFSPTIFFGFPLGEPSEEEMRAIDNKLNAKYSGSNKAGGVITAYYEPGADNKVDVQILDVTDADKQYEWLKKTTQQEILVGHKVTNENLVGISTPGKLGSSTELLQSYELYYNTVVEPEQQSILKQLNKIMAYNGLNDVVISQKAIIANSFSENILKEILTRDEIREELGYEPLDNEDVEDDGTIAIMENKVLRPNDVIHFNSKEYTLSDKIIDANTGLPSDADDKAIYVWALGDGGLSKENCPACIEHSGKLKALRSWKRTAIPGMRENAALKVKYRHGPYGTYCEEKCTCKLIKID